MLEKQSQNNLELKALETTKLSCPRCQEYNFIKRGKNKRGVPQFFCKNCKKLFIQNQKIFHAKHYLPDGISAEQMFDYDVWDLRILGLKPTVSSGQYTLNFFRIELPWLKNAIKQWIKYRSASEQASTLKAKLESLSSFSQFITSKGYTSSQQINRIVIQDYLVFGINKNYSWNHKYHLICDLKSFLEDCVRFSWLEISKEPLIYKEDYPKTERSLPRFIPEEILKQLDNSLNCLAEPVARMIEILRETGIRISELIELKRDCLQQDNQGIYWIKVYQSKMKKEINLCITKELATLIHRQQEYIKINLPTNFQYLFCTTKCHSYFDYFGTSEEKHHRKRELNFFEPVTKKLNASTLRGYMKKLVEEKQIKDASGQQFKLSKLHQFRHTHGTDLINNGVPQHIVQKRLGHASPEMTAVYAHIHDKTMKQEMEKFWDGRVVNNKGEIIVPENPDLDTADMQWIKRNMKAQALPDGFCGLPVTKSCPVQGSPCLTCSHLRTTIEFLDIHKKHLEETEKLIENARQNGWDRQIETNLSIVENLKKIIRGLEQKEVIFGDENFSEQEGGEQSA
jgi:integrase